MPFEKLVIWNSPVYELKLKGERVEDISVPEESNKLNDYIEHPFAVFWIELMVDNEAIKTEYGVDNVWRI